MIDKVIGNKQNLALLIARVAVGLIFMAHGIQKFQGGITGVAGFFNSLGIPAPQFFAWIVALIETFGGAALVLGIFTRISALLLSVVMVVAIITVKIKVGLIAPMAQGAGMELDLALLAGLLSLVLQGSGIFSLEERIRYRR
jgi:uncharacterized membrane protein YphA (DoxX/SURF4 family)